MIDPNKYVVHRRAELEAWEASEGEGDQPEPIEDAVVILKRDVFAAGVFYAYAGAVMGAAEALEGYGPKAQIERDALEDIADFFMGQADEARASNVRHAGKLPTP